MGCINSERSEEKSYGRILDADSLNDNSLPEVKTSDVHSLPNFWSNFELKEQVGVGLQDEQLCVVENRETRALYLSRVIAQEEQFMKEFTLVRKLCNPFLARFKEAFKDNKKYFILYEYCAGGGLLERITKQTYYNERIASQTMKMMLKAVQYLHNLDIAHRGIRPRAFIYSSENGPGLKLIEFGFAMQVFPKMQYKSRCGSPYFMAPEEVRNTQPRSAATLKKADMWALGVCSYIMLMGKNPFTGSTRNDVFRRVCKRKLIFPGVSNEAEDFMKRLLERNPNARLSIEEAIDHPWIKRGGENPHQIMQSAISALRSFNVKDSFQQAMHHVSLSNLSLSNNTERNDEYFRELFSCFDRDGNGVLTYKECVEAINLHLVGAGQPKKIAKEIMNQSSDGNTLTFQNFKSAMEAYQLKNDFLIQAIYFALDVNADGYISFQELIFALPKSTSEMISNNLESFSKADVDGDKHLSYDEFKVLFSEEMSRKEFVDEIMEFVNNGMVVVDDNEPFTTRRSLPDIH